MPNRLPENTTSFEFENRAANFLRMPMVVRFTGLARSTIYKLISEKKFPSPVKVSERAVAWRRTDLDRWSRDRPPAAH